MMSRSTLQLFLWSAWLVMLDQVSKFMALVYLNPWEAVSILPGLNLTLTFNTGAAFSLFAHNSGWQIGILVLISSMVSMGIIIHYLRLKNAAISYRYGLILILGGAIGNLIDRIRLGQVIDFIDLYVSHYHWPVFNVADSAICIGAGLIIWYGLREA